MGERVGNAQREKVVELLGKALAEGYLDLAEYEQRMTAATAAKTTTELSRQLADLPISFQWDPRQHRMSALQVRPPQTQPETGTANGTAIASLALGALSLPMSLCFGAGALLGLIAVVLSFPGMRSSASHTKAVLGLILGCFGTALSIGMLVLYFLGDDVTA